MPWLNLMKATFAIAGHVHALGGFSTICARRQVTSDPLGRRTFRTSRRLQKHGRRRACDLLECAPAGNQSQGCGAARSRVGCPWLPTRSRSQQPPMAPCYQAERDCSR
jgi:hypothetical protein